MDREVLRYAIRTAAIIITRTGIAAIGKNDQITASSSDQKSSLLFAICFTASSSGASSYIVVEPIVELVPGHRSSQYWATENRYRSRQADQSDHRRGSHQKERPRDRNEWYRWR